mmetsp:Transcript_20442/g.29988  ORF Transcript_20442/g.29988 Transcript_20442/m.29988 type:complete len:238 (-) Transcript_20442:145-858(-)
MCFVEAPSPVCDMMSHVSVCFTSPLAKGRNARQKNVEDHTQTPHISLGGVAIVQKDFGRGVRECAQLSCQVLPALLPSRNELSKAKVGKLDLLVGVIFIQNVFGFEVAVYHAPRVHVSESLEHLSEAVGSVALSKFAAFSNAPKHLAAACHFHHQVQHVLGFKPILELDDAGVIYFCHRLDLAAVFTRVAEPNHLDCKLNTVVPTPSTNHLATRSHSIFRQASPHFVKLLNRRMRTP